MIDPHPTEAASCTLLARRVVRSGGVGPAAVTIRNGVIEAIGPLEEARGRAGSTIVDLGEAALLPGLVDTHVHVNEPGRTTWEGFRTATRAAAAGGVTTIVDMPLNSDPVTTTPAALAEKVAAARSQIVVDVGFWGGLVPSNAGAIAALLDTGVLGLKCFLCPSGLDAFPPVDEALLRRVLPVMAARDAVLLVHAEDPALLAAAAPPAADLAERRRHARHLASRPAAAERSAIARLIALARETGGHVHVVHLADAGSVELLAAARADGVPITVETCPHYLCLDAEAVPDGGTAFKCAPPLRPRPNREGLWSALGRGVVDLVVSDHSPCPPALKRLDDGDFDAAWGGIASLELGLAAVWTEARARGFTLADVARWMSAGPAALARLAGKGAIRVGAEADLVVFDPDEEVTVNAAALHQRHPVTPYTGRTLCGRVRRTYLRGRVVHEDGAFPPVAAGSPAGVLRWREGAGEPDDDGTAGR